MRNGKLEIGNWKSKIAAILLFAAFCLLPTTLFGTAASVSPPWLTFGAGIVGAAEATQAITLTAASTSSMTSIVVTVSTGGSNLTEFTDSTSPSTNCGGTLTASSTCTITVTFTPGALGTRTGAITVTSSQGTLVVPLTGTGGTQTQNFSTEIYTLPVPPVGGTSISATTMVTPAVTTSYWFGSYVTEVAVGSGGTCNANTTVTVNLIYQDPNAASAQTTALAVYTTGSAAERLAGFPGPRAGHGA